MLKKLIKKFISKRLQVQSISSNFVHLNQLGELKQCSTMLWQPLVKIITKPLSKLKSKVSCGDYKRTQQGVTAVFLYYLYDT